MSWQWGEAGRLRFVPAGHARRSIRWFPHRLAATRAQMEASTLALGLTAGAPGPPVKSWGSSEGGSMVQRQVRLGYAKARAERPGLPHLELSGAFMPRPSTGEYPDFWPQLAHAIKEAAGWRCERCGHKHDPAAGYGLTVHHMDLDKSNCRWWNVIALCQRCHLHIQGKVNLDQMWPFEHADWFKPYAAGWYAYRYLGEEISRAEAEAKMGELLALERIA